MKLLPRHWPDLAGPGSKADEGSDLTAIERAELRQFSDQGASDDRPDAGDGCEQVLLFSPDRRAAHTIVDLAIEFGEFFLHCFTQPGDAPLQTLVGHPPLALTSCAEEFHLRALPKPCMNLSTYTAPDVRPFP